MDMPELAVQESVNVADQPLSAQTDEPLASKASEENVPAGPSESTPALSPPRSSEEISPFLKAQPKGGNNKSQTKKGRPRVLRDTP